MCFLFFYSLEELVMKNYLATLLLLGALAFVGCTKSGPEIGDNENGSDGTVDANKASDEKDADKTKIDPKDRQ